MSTSSLNQNLLNVTFLIVFVLLVVFDLTVYKFIWGIEAISRIANLFILILFTVFSAICISTMKMPIKIWIFIIFPALLMFFSTFINVSRFAYQDTSIISFYGTLLPIVSLLSVPFLMKLNVINTEKIYSYYYKAILIIVSISLIEYSLIFTGYLTPTLITTSGGNFLAANFSILFDLEDNIFNETDFSLNFYAAIIESGTLAMLILPALIYAIYKKLFIGFLILLLSIFATNSLGGFMSLAVFALIYPYIETRLVQQKPKTGKSIFIFIYILVLISLSGIVISFLIDYYNTKFLTAGPTTSEATSGSTRINNIIMLFSNLPTILIENPIGYTLSTDSNKILSGSFYGFNIGLGISIYNGGFLSLLGYVMLTLTFVTASIRTLVRKNIDINKIIASTSLLVLFPFFVQRGSVFETSILILLTTPFVVEFLKGEDYSVKLNQKIKT